MMSDTNADRKQIDAVNRRFEAAVAKGDVGEAIKAYAEDGRVMPPDAPMAQGHAALEAYWKAAAAGLGIQSVRLETLELDIVGSTAIEVGRAHLQTKTGPAKVKFVVIWRKKPEGWRWYVDIFNMDPAS
jgi:ketosteroid isomerase-like protein